MSLYINFNINPANKRVGDCTVRAIATALNESWEKTYLNLCMHGFSLCDMPSANHVWGEYLKSKGFSRKYINNCDDCMYTVADFCKDNPQGVYILALQSHVLCVKDGRYYDTWDSGEEIPLYRWCKE